MRQFYQLCSFVLYNISLDFLILHICYTAILPFLVYSFVCVNMTSSYELRSVGIIILLFQIPSAQPGTTSFWFLCSFAVPHHFFQPFNVFWHHKIFYLISFFPCLFPGVSHSPRSPDYPFIVLGSRIQQGSLALRCAHGQWGLVDFQSLSDRAREVCVPVYTHTVSISMCFSLFIQSCAFMVCHQIL